jgi:DNA-binding SARP family transcriptional activator
VAVGGIAEIVGTAAGAMFAVDERLRIIAWNQAAERLLGVREPVVLGTRCFETVHAVDTDTGRPCYESCPLMDSSAPHGWVHSKVLEAEGSRHPGTLEAEGGGHGPEGGGHGSMQLDCMLLRYVLPSAEHGTLSFVTPLGAVDAADYVRALAATESLYPLLSRSSDAEASLRHVAQTLLQVTRADVAELLLLDAETREPFLTIRRTAGQVDESASPAWQTKELVGLVASSQEALVAIQPVQPDSQDAACWRLGVPIVAEERLLGVLALTSRRSDFSIGFAARVLFPVAAQLGVYLRWALLADGSAPPAGANGTATPGPAADTAAAPGPRGAHTAAAGPTLAFYCFGRFRVVRDGRELPTERFKRRRSLSLLKLLVANRGRPFRREALIEALWPETDPELGSNNLRVVLHDLRHGLEPELGRGGASSFILGRGDLLYLDPSERCWTDVEQFERLAGAFEAQARSGLDEAALEAGRAAVALYGGAYLEDEPYLDWCIAEREHLREAYVNLLHSMGTLLARRGAVHEAIQACRQALEADPPREKIHRQLMGLLAAAGYRALALRQYETCRRVLRDELDVEPDAETHRAYEAIAAGNGA